MATELYIGLVALQAGLLAASIAAVLVIIQTGGEAVSAHALRFLLTRKRLLVVGALCLLLVMFDLAAAIRTAYPDFEALPGNQHTERLLTDAWPAVLAAGGWIASLLATGAILFGLASTVRGPGVATELLQHVTVQDWRDWLELRSPPEPPPPSLMFLLDSEQEPSEETIRAAESTRSDLVRAGAARRSELERLHAGGQLGDPSAPIFEMSIAALQARRYSVAEQILGQIGQEANRWFTSSVQDQMTKSDLISVLLQHLREVLNAALEMEAEGHADATLRLAADMAHAAVLRGDASLTTTISDEIADWACTLARFRRQWLTSRAIATIRGIAIAALEADNLDQFEQGALALAHVSEALAREHQGGRPVPMLRGTYGREDADPVNVLTDALSELVRRFTLNGRQTRGHISNVRLLADALVVEAHACLNASPLDKQMDEAAASAVEGMALIGLGAARIKNGDALGMVAYELDKVAQLNLSRNGSATASALAHGAFEIGIIAEANRGRYLCDGRPARSDYAMELARVCSCAGADATQEAVTNLFMRGHTMHTSDDDQRAFLRKVETLMGRRFRGGYGDSSTG